MAQVESRSRAALSCFPDDSRLSQHGALTTPARTLLLANRAFRRTVLGRPGTRGANVRAILGFSFQGAFDQRRWPRKRIDIGFRDCLRMLLAPSVIRCDNLLSNHACEWHTPRSKCARKFCNPRGSCHPSNVIENQGNIAMPIVVYHTRAVSVVKRHGVILPINLPALTITYPPPYHWWRDMHKSKPQRPTLDKGKARSVELLHSRWIHQISGVATRASKASHFPNRVSARFPAV
jgi:hypothetical protein